MTQDVLDGTIANGDMSFDVEARKLAFRLGRAMTKSQLAAAFHDTHRDWDQLCQAGVRQACSWTGSAPPPNYLSANEAYRDSHIVSTDPDKAPMGSVHFWGIGKYGHVAGGLGGRDVFMCSRHVDSFWGINVGTTTVQAYTRLTGATYHGWARSDGHNTMRLKVETVKPAPDSASKYTTAHRGEGLSAIAARCGVSLGRVQALNPRILPPEYVVKIGQRVRYK